MNFKSITISLSFIIYSIIGFSQISWHNPEKSEVNPISGQYWQGEKRANFYNRFPDEFKNFVRPILWKLSCDTAGESVRFRTNSPSITIRYHLTDPLSKFDYIAHTGSDGVDLYARNNDGEQMWLNSERNFADTITYVYSPITYKNVGANRGYEFDLYLPYSNSVDFMEIGVVSGKIFEFIPPRKELPIAIYGTSITQGVAASRPGMIWSTILSRRLDIPVINLGFEGNGKLEDDVVDIFAEIDARVFIIDCMPNLFARAAGQLSQLIVEQVKRIRESNPATPIILTDHLGFPQGKVYKSFGLYETNVLAAQKDAFDTLTKSGVKNIYHLTKEMLNIDDEMMIEGIHPSDYGMKLYADAYEKLIREILDMPKGEITTTIPVQQNRSSGALDWIKRHEDAVAANSEKKFKKAFIGNSIIHRFGGVEGYKWTIAPELWSKLYGDYQNMGYSWDRIENVLWRVEHGALDGTTFDEIIMKIGTNNLSVNDSDEDILSGLKNLLNAIHVRQKGAKITLLAILPRRDMEKRIKTLNSKISAMAKGFSYVVYKDIGGGLLLPSGKINEKLFSDGLHPNKAGYSAIFH